ncbi:MAG: hypothetical protein AAFV62_12535, partial [Pseudomonadota bacterium]
MTQVQHLTVGPEESDQRLDRWFKRYFPHVSHGRVEKMLRKGEIRIGQGRHAHRLPCCQPVRRFRPRPVDADLALSEHFLDPAMRNMGKVALEP